MKAKLQYGFNLINIYMCCVLQSEAWHCVLVHASCSLSDSVCNVSERFTTVLSASALSLGHFDVHFENATCNNHLLILEMRSVYQHKTETLWFSAKSFSKVWHLKNEEIKIDRHKYKYCNFTVVIKIIFYIIAITWCSIENIFKGLTFEKLRN